MPVMVNQHFLCNNFFTSLYLNTKHKGLEFTVRAIVYQIKSSQANRSIWSKIFLPLTWKKMNNEQKLLGSLNKLENYHKINDFLDAIDKYTENTKKINPNEKGNTYAFYTTLKDLSSVMKGDNKQKENHIIYTAHEVDQLLLQAQTSDIKREAIYTDLAKKAPLNSTSELFDKVFFQIENLADIDKKIVGFTALASNPTLNDEQVYTVLDEADKSLESEENKVPVFTALASKPIFSKNEFENIPTLVRRTDEWENEKNQVPLLIAVLENITLNNEKFSEMLEKAEKLENDDNKKFVFEKLARNPMLGRDKFVGLFNKVEMWRDEESKNLVFSKLAGNPAFDKDKLVELFGNAKSWKDEKHKSRVFAALAGNPNFDNKNKLNYIFGNAKSWKDEKHKSRVFAALASNPNFDNKNKLNYIFGNAKSWKDEKHKIRVFVALAGNPAFGKDKLDDIFKEANEKLKNDENKSCVFAALASNPGFDNKHKLNYIFEQAKDNKNKNLIFVALAGNRGLPSELTKNVVQKIKYLFEQDSVSFKQLIQQNKEKILANSTFLQLILQDKDAHFAIQFRDALVET